MKTIRCNLVLIATLAMAVPLEAQQPATLGAARVTLVDGPSPSQGGRTEVIRHAGRSPQNVVVISTNATADDLAGALAMINALRVKYGDTSSVRYRASPGRIRHGPSWQGSEYRKWLTKQLVRLRKAGDTSLGELGVVKAVEIMLPPPPTKATIRPAGD
jgi:hypothetical protein